MQKKNGFTIIELMVGVAMLGIIMSIAIPSFNSWTVEMRVDDEISKIHRLLLISRNTAISMEQPVTICPLSSLNECSTNWKGEISVFIDLDANGKFETGLSKDIDGDGINETVSDTMIRVKDRINTSDELTFTNASVTYQPTGQIINSALSGTGAFQYCPKNNSDKNRAIVLSIRGRAYTSSDTDNDGKDELRDNSAISC